MEPKTLSASAIKTFQDCEAMYLAHYIDRVREGSGAPAELGTAVHDTCEWAVVQGKMTGPVKDLIAKFEAEAARYGLDKTMVKDGKKMLTDFHTRWQQNPPHEVLSCEVKESFSLKSRDGNHEIEVNYIWDRGDRHPDGSVEVIDYKTWRKVVDAEEMLRMQQTRIYALSAAIRYKKEKPPAIWVTLDQMRTAPVSVKFSREDNMATWNWLRDVYQQILESDGSQETINENCQYCARKATCATLDRAYAQGNIALLRADPARAARTLAEMKAAKSAVEYTISELEEFMEELLEHHDVPELNLGGVKVKMTVRKNRKPQTQMIANLVGPAMVESLGGKLGMAEIDRLLEHPDLTDEVKAEIKLLIKVTVTGKASAYFPK